MADLVGLDQAAATIKQTVEETVPALRATGEALITDAGTVLNTVIVNAGVMLRGVIKEFFDGLDKLSARYSLPVRITIDKPEE